MLNFNCRDNTQPVASTSVHIEPAYSDCKLIVQQDTLRFALNDRTFNEIKSFNYFTDHNTPYISFYDRRSESEVIYDFASQRLIKRIELKKALKEKELFKGSVYVHNFDSIFVTHYTHLYLLDSAGIVKKKIKFFEEKESFAFFETSLPVVVKNNLVYMGVRPFISETSISDIRDWRILYGFDFQNKTKKLHYALPSVYKKDLFGKRFMEYSYCYNDKGMFVFGFPADTSIYETNLAEHHNAYYAGSKFQQGSIEPVSKEVLEKDEGRKEYFLRDSYGPIYYDPYRKRYFRFFKQKISRSAYDSKNFDRQVSVVVLNEQFKVIGEFMFTNDYSYNAIFFTTDGGIYARVNPKDEHTLHFVQLSWSDKNEPIPLTKK